MAFIIRKKKQFHALHKPHRFGESKLKLISFFLGRKSPSSLKKTNKQTKKKDKQRKKEKKTRKHLTTRSEIQHGLVGQVHFAA